MIDCACGKSASGWQETAARSEVNQDKPSINPCAMRSCSTRSASGKASALVMRAISKPSEYAYSLMVVTFSMAGQHQLVTSRLLFIHHVRPIKNTKQKSKQIP